MKKEPPVQSGLLHQGVFHHEARRSFKLPKDCVILGGILYGDSGWRTSFFCSLVSWGGCLAGLYP